MQLFVCGRVPLLYQYWPVGFMVLRIYVQELPKAQPAVVLVLKRLRTRGSGLKSHPTDWEKPGIEPETPGCMHLREHVKFVYLILLHQALIRRN